MTEVNKIENLGRKIKNKRKAERLSAEDLAQKLGLKAANIYKWEKGSNPSDAEEYLAITAWLNNSEYIPKKSEESVRPIIKDDAADYNSPLPIGNFQVTLGDYVNLLKEKARIAEERERDLIDIIKGKLNNIETNSKEIADDISALTIENQAAHRALMDSVDVAAEQPIGTTRGAAGIVEIASEEERVDKGKKVGTGKHD